MSISLLYVLYEAVVSTSTSNNLLRLLLYIRRNKIRICAPASVCEEKLINALYYEHCSLQRYQIVLHKYSIEHAHPQ